MSYEESKKKLNQIRQEYGCKGDVIFRTAMQYIVEHGQYNFRNQKWFDSCIENVDKKHDLADRNGKHLWIGRDFEKALLECAKELADINAYDLLTYIQREVWLSGNGIDYQRAITLCKNVIDWMVADTYETSVALDEVREMGFTDDEIDELGFAWMFGEDCEMED